MTLDEFKKEVEVLSEGESDILRELYIEQFVDTSKEHYLKYISNRELFSDGACYTGYLWDCLFQSEKVAIQHVFEDLNSYKEVLIFWDIHSCDRILIKDYWKFPKDRVIRINSHAFKKGIEYLPEDIYIFDYSISWTYILTHEDDGKRRICLKIDKN